MESGKLRHRITIESRASTLSDAGEEIGAWSTFAEAWASIEPLSGREVYYGSQLHAEATTRIRLRYMAGVLPQMRVTFGTRTFDILAVINTEERNRELELLCAERS